MTVASLESYPLIRVELRTKDNRARWDQVRSRPSGRLHVAGRWKPVEQAQREAEAFARRHKLPLVVI